MLTWIVRASGSAMAFTIETIMDCANAPARYLVQVLRSSAGPADIAESEPGSIAGRSDSPAADLCPTDETLAAYADQGLAPAEQDVVETHLATCERCRRSVALAVEGAAQMRQQAGVAVFHRH